MRCTVGALAHTLPHVDGIDCVWFSQNGKKLLTVGGDKTLRVWHLYRPALGTQLTPYTRNTLYVILSDAFKAFKKQD